MNWELVYDAVTMSSAAPDTARWAAGIAIAAMAWGGWLNYRGRPVHVAAKMLGAIAIVVFAVSLLFRWELRKIGQRTDLKTVDGPVTYYWKKQVRTKTAANGSTYRTTDWEGFELGGVNFAVERFPGQNYFHNTGPGEIRIRDGVFLRLTYYDEGEGDSLTRRIIKVERGVPAGASN